LGAQRLNGEIVQDFQQAVGFTLFPSLGRALGGSVVGFSLFHRDSFANPGIF
jgi:hypothetical protein